MTLPLEGITVLELTRVAPGALATMMLGDMGAEVVKVEQPVQPDTPRFGGGWCPVGEEGRREAAYSAVNRNKKSVAINLRSAEGRAIFHKLAVKADVILEGFRPGVVKRLGIDFDTISKINPRAIYCSLSGYGQDGPYQDMPGHDVNYISIGGALGLIGEEGGKPVIPLNLVADYAGASLHAVIGILLALMARERTGKGQVVDISYTDGVISLMTRLASDYFMSGEVPKRGQSFLSGAYPCYGVYETKDGRYISIGCLEQWLWENLCRALDREDLIVQGMAQGEKREEVFGELRGIFRTRTRDEWFEELRDKDVCVGKVYELDEVFEDPQVVHRQMVVELDHPIFGKVKQPGIGVKLSDTPGSIRSFCPLLGEHTEAVLGSLGYSAEEVEELKRRGVVM